MARPLVIRRAVERDLSRAYRWYEQERTGLGELFLASVDRTLDAIEEFNERFVSVRGDVRRATVSRFPYSLFYRVEPTRVVVLRALHSARDPRRWPA